MVFYPTHVQAQRLTYQVRAAFGAEELAEGAAKLVPELLRLTGHLLQTDADLARLGEMLQPLLMALPMWLPFRGGEPQFDLAPLALAASRARDLNGLLRQFLPGRETQLMRGLLVRAKSASEPFGVVSECYRAVLDARDEAHARAILAEMGAVIPAGETPFVAIIAGARVWCYIEGESGAAWHLTLELRELDPDGSLSRETFEDARAVNQILLRYAFAAD